VLKSALGLLLLGVSLLAAPREAAALVGHYAAGALNARDLFLPPLNGTFFALYTYFYVADTFRDRNGHAVESVTIRGRTIELDTQINLYNVSPALMWLPKWNVLGGRYAAFVVLSVANPVSTPPSKARTAGSSWTRTPGASATCSCSRSGSSGAGPTST
jgi:hypothetical protein